MDYLLHYKKLIRKANKLQVIRKEQKKNKFEYFEKHHIIPVSICKLRNKSKKQYNKSWNLVLLTAREHFIAHELLFRFYNKLFGKNHIITQKLLFAWGMFWQKSGQRAHINSNGYERLRIAHINTIKGVNFLTEESIERMKQNMPDFSGINNSSFGKKWAYCPKTGTEILELPNNIPKGYIMGKAAQKGGTLGKIMKSRKKFRIYKNNGEVLEIIGMNQWCKQNGYFPAGVRSVMLKNSSYYKDIVKVEKL